MIKLWQPVREFLPIAAILLLCLIIVPVAQANDNGNSNNGTNATVVQQAAVQTGTTATAPAETVKTTKSKPKVATTKPQDKSVLDNEVLNSPINYFKKAFTTEEDESDAASSNGAVMITVKALIATLLSTIM